MSRAVFSSWAGKVVDNRGLAPDKYVDVDDPGFPLEYGDQRIDAFISWNGVVVADESVDIVDMAYSYLKEVQKLSCGECTIGYLGIKIMLDTLAKLLSGEGEPGDIDWLQWLGSSIGEDARCDFCASAVTPVLDTIKYYREEYAKLIGGKGKATGASYLIRVTAPCMEACPAHQDIPGYIELIRNRRYAEALEVIRKTNCLPGMTGRACVAFCEANCVRNDIDKPLAIRALKRIPADYEMDNDLKPEFEVRKGDGTKVAVIGAGPAGLAASYNLALMGHKVTIYDEQSSGGGMALAGIPTYRLPDAILEREVDIIKDLGIELKLNTRVGKDITLKEIFADGFKAVFVATGAHLSRKFEIENWKEEYDGVVDGVELLRDFNLDKKIASRGRVIIVGGGNVAMDCARTCLRFGCEDVSIVYRRSRAEMPGRREEIESAENEGVKIHFLAVPVKVLAEGNKVIGAECIRMELGEPDASGRRRPVPIKGSEFVMEADMIIAAIGEMPDLSFLTGTESVDTTDWGTISVDRYTYQTSMPGVFAGGDSVNGPATVIEAIAAGNRAAKSIDQYLKSGKVTVSDDDLMENLLHNVDLKQRRGRSITARNERQHPEELPVADSIKDFSEVEQCFEYEVAVKEAERCLRCYRVMLAATTSEKQSEKKEN